MLAIQLQRRRMCQAVASLMAATVRNDRRPSNSVIGGFVGNSVVLCFRSGGGSEQAPRSRHDRRRRQRRFFSSSSATDEVVVIQEDSPSPLTSPTPVSPGAVPDGTTSTAAAAAAVASVATTTTTHARMEWQHSPTSFESTDPRRRPPRRRRQGGGPVGIYDDEYMPPRGERDEFHRAWTEYSASLPHRDGDETANEVLASVDRFMVLLDHPDLGNHLGSMAPTAGGVRITRGLPSRARLHHSLLCLVDRCLPPTPTSSSTGEKNDGRKSHEYFGRSYSAATVGRALRLSRRAEELGLPPHRPLYRRLAVGVVLTSSSSCSSYPATIVQRRGRNDDADAESASPPLVPPIDSSLGEEGSPVLFALPLELLGILEGARLALGIHGKEELQQLARDILADPVLLLLEARRLEEAAGLVRGWKEALGVHAFAAHDLTSLLGEESALRALDIARGWVDDVELADRVASNRDVSELTIMLEGALDEVLRGRRRRAEKISHLLWRLSLRDEEDIENFDENDGESDSDYEVEFDYEEEEEEEEEEELYSPTPAFLKGNESVQLANFEADDKDTMTVSFTAENLSESELVNEEGDDGESYTIIRGLSNKEARRSIYIRNSADWHLADIVPQLQDWNKGRMPTFTPMFEKYVGNLIANCASDSDDEEEYDED